MRRLTVPVASAVLVMAAVAVPAQTWGADSAPAITNLLEIKRIYIAPLVGGVAAASLRELLMASLDSSKLFLMTDNPDRADAILKGAADDQTFTDSFDIDQGLNARESVGVGSGRTRSSTGGSAGLSIGDNESRHTRERKHEAYATVRLCNREG